MPRLRFLILTAILTFIPLALSAQTLRGHVYIAGTDTVIAGASVYYNASTTGTITDKYGQFELPARSQQIPVTISCVGYFSSTVNYEPDKPLIVYLKPKVVELKTVAIRIRTNDLDRKQEERLFVQEFLGISEFAKSCTIVNLDDVDLYYNNKTGMLTADCEKPIIIQNKKLGYIVNYYLDNFSRTISSTHYAGNFNFKEDSAISSADRTKILSNRERAYNGSRMQFIRALWSNTLDGAGFVIKNQRNQPLALTQILTIDSLKQKYLYLENGIFIYHNSDLSYKNILNTARKYIFIDQNGYYGQGLQWTGRMSDQRVGDQLPFEYRSKNDPVENITDAVINNSAAVPAIAASLAQSPADNLANAKTPSDNTIPVFFEKAYLHTDRNTYAQGEDIWFKAYLVNAQTNEPINYSHNLYVELINPAGKITSRQMLRLENGLANGDIKLADTLTAGNYRLRAYTNWMRNFGDNFIFEKDIRLVTDELSSPIATKTAVSKKQVVKAGPLPKINPGNLPVVRFFPEGGAMVIGVSSIIAVKAEDENGRGIAAKGSIQDNNGETIAGFVCDSLGFGAFTLLPDASQHYQALVNIHQKDRRFILPGAVAFGFNMHVQDKQNQLTISISCNDATLDKNNGQRIYLEVKHGGKTFVKQTSLLTDKSLLVKIPDDRLAEGVSSVTVSDAKNLPLCERLVYIHKAFDAQLAINTNKTVYQPKEQVTIHIKLNKPGIAHLSLAAVDALTVPVQPENIASYLQLQSEVRGRIEQAARYFDTTNINRFKQLDLLLLTQGWRSFVWKRLEDTTLKFDREVEQAITITGRVRRQMTDKPMAGMHIALHAPKAEGDKFFEANTDSAGRFAIYGPVFYGYQYLNFSSRNFDEKNKGKSNSGGWIKVDSLNHDVLPINAVNNVVKDTLPSAEETMMRLKVPKKQQLKGVKILASIKFLPEVHAITLADQKDYGNVLQYLLYVIPGAHVDGGPAGDLRDGNIWVKRNPKPPPYWLITFGFHINVTSTYSDGSRIDPLLAYGQDPLYMPITSAVNITITKFVNMAGYVTYKANVALRPGAFAMKDYFDNTTADMVGYYKARVFYTPKFGSIDDTSDPRRNTIHWEPNITTDKNGQATITYYNADPKTKVMVVAEGLTASGIPVTAAANYTVR